MLGDELMSVTGGVPVPHIGEMVMLGGTRLTGKYKVENVVYDYTKLEITIGLEIV